MAQRQRRRKRVYLLDKEGKRVYEPINSKKYILAQKSNRKYLASLNDVHTRNVRASYNYRQMRRDGKGHAYSYIVSIPWAFCEALDISIGDKMKIAYDSENKIIIMTKEPNGT